jgi:hypothetical protein
MRLGEKLEEATKKYIRVFELPEANFGGVPVTKVQINVYKPYAWTTVLIETPCKNYHFKITLSFTLDGQIKAWAFYYLDTTGGYDIKDQNSARVHGTGKATKRDFDYMKHWADKVVELFKSQAREIIKRRKYEKEQEEKCKTKENPKQSKQDPKRKTESGKDKKGSATQPSERRKKEAQSPPSSTSKKKSKKLSKTRRT